MKRSAIVEDWLAKYVQSHQATKEFKISEFKAFLLINGLQFSPGYLEAYFEARYHGTLIEVGH